MDGDSFKSITLYIKSAAWNYEFQYDIIKSQLIREARLLVHDKENRRPWIMRMERSPSTQIKESIALLNPGTFKEERACLSERRRTYEGWTNGRMDGRLHNSDDRDEGSRGSRRKRGILCLALYIRDYALRGAGGGGFGFGNLVHRQ